MRMRDHHKGDLALAALTLSAAVAAAGGEVVRWVRNRPRGHRRSAPEPARPVQRRHWTPPGR